MTAITMRRKRRHRHGTAESMALAIELWLRDVDVDDGWEPPQVDGGVVPAVGTRTAG